MLNTQVIHSRIQNIRLLATKDKLAFKKHSLIRMHERDIAADEVREILIRGQIIEDYPEDKPFPSCLISGSTIYKKPIHVVVAEEDEEMLWIITVYQPNPEEWEDGFERRKT